MLLSYVNMQLRDNYKNLEELREGLSLSQDELKAIVDKLEMISYVYKPELNQFK